MRNAPVVCDACDDPVVSNVSGWYRCRSCGHESLRDFDPASTGSGVQPVAREARDSLHGAGLVSLFDK